MAVSTCLLANASREIIQEACPHHSTKSHSVTLLLVSHLSCQLIDLLLKNGLLLAWVSLAVLLVLDKWPHILGCELVLCLVELEEMVSFPEQALCHALVDWVLKGRERSLAPLARSAVLQLLFSLLNHGHDLGISELLSPLHCVLLDLSNEISLFQLLLSLFTELPWTQLVQVVLKLIHLCRQFAFDRLLHSWRGFERLALVRCSLV